MMARDNLGAVVLRKKQEAFAILKSWDQSRMKVLNTNKKIIEQFLHQIDRRVKISEQGSVKLFEYFQSQVKIMG